MHTFTTTVVHIVNVYIILLPHLYQSYVSIQVWNIFCIKVETKGSDEENCYFNPST